MNYIPLLLTVATTLAASHSLRAAVLLAVDIDERDAVTGTAVPGSTQPGFSSFVADAVGGGGAIQNAPTTRNFGLYNVTIGGVAGTEPPTVGTPTGNGVAAAGYDDRRRTVPVNGLAFTNENLLRDFIFSRDANNGGLDITIAGLAPSTAYVWDIWSYDEGSNGGTGGGARVSDWIANGILVQDDYSFRGETINPLPAGPPTPADNSFGTFQFVATTDANGQMLLQARRQAASTDGTNPTFGVFLNAFQVSEIPEPSSAALALTALVAGTFRRRRNAPSSRA